MGSRGETTSKAVLECPHFTCPYTGELVNGWRQFYVFKLRWRTESRLIKLQRVLIINKTTNH